MSSFLLILKKVNQLLQIDRDAPRMKGIPEEHEKRRSVFWELLNMDCRMVCIIPMGPDFFPIIIFFTHYFSKKIESFTWTTTFNTASTC
jgi:hypothetical protein